MRKYLIIAVTAAAVSLGAFFAVGCGSSNSAFVTINLNRPGVACFHKQPGIWDKVAGAFEGELWAGSNVSTTHGTLSIVITGNDINTINASIPTNATTFTIEVPSGLSRNFTLYSYDTSFSYNNYNYGGNQIVDLFPGDEKEIIIKMNPMTKVYSLASVTGSIVVSCWQHSDPKVIKYNFYRSTNPSHGFVLIQSTSSNSLSDNNGGLGLNNTITYYYKFSITTSGNVEGLWSDYISGKPL